MGVVCVREERGCVRDGVWFGEANQRRVCVTPEKGLVALETGSV